MESYELFARASLEPILLISTLQVARIIGISYWPSLVSVFIGLTCVVMVDGSKADLSLKPLLGLS
jgi:hypothetical protein